MLDSHQTIPSTSGQRYELVEREVAALLGREVAATYMQTRNFALGGLMPAVLVATEEGTRKVLSELSAHGAGGPL